MTPAELQVAVGDLVRSAAARRGADLSLSDSDIVLERPRSREHGDWASTVAMRVAKRIGVPPRDLAAELVIDLGALDGIANASVAGPGFINITLETASAAALAARIVAEGEAYGRGDAFAGIRTNLEFVSANPTGPVHLGGGRWAAVGDSLARVLEAQGAIVGREYYFNDHGTQIDRFAKSLLASYRGLPTPDDGYGGDYIAEIKDRVVALAPEGLAAMADEEAQEVFRSIGVDLMFDEVKQTLAAFRVDFDVYFHENDLYETGAVERAVARLRELGHIYEADGAVWLRTTEFGDDRDRVVVKSNGETAYIAGDLAYYLDKRERGFEQCLLLLGADHHGYIGRLMAMVAAFGDTPYVSLQVLIGQMVNLVRDGTPLRMSKRAGTVVTLEDLVDVVGVDAARYTLVRSSIDTQLDVDLDLVSKRTNDNPVYYVQYAHARTRSVARKAATASVTREVDGHDAFDPTLLAHPTESELLGVLEQFPRTVERSATLREPHRVARYLEQLAGTYHRWYDSCRVIPLADEPIEAVHRTRLVLNEAVAQVLRNGLGLLGVTAPERM